jgi:tetratricopeptide (TPR) repeat protein
MVVFEVSSEVNVLEEAITVYEEALQLEPVLSDHRAQSMSDLGNALFWFCWFCGSDKERSDHCVEMLRGALDMRPSGHPLRDESLHYLARAHFHIGFELQLGGLNALSEAASMSREAVRLRPPGHPDRVKSLNTLAGTLKASFTTSGNLAFLTESISISREAVQCHSVGHPDRVRMLCNLGTLLCTIIDQTSDLGLLAEAIAVLREALENCSDEPPLRVTILDNLGSALSLRFSLQGHADSLSEAIALGREAMQFMPDTYYGRAYTSNNLAESLIAGFEQSGNVELLAEAVSLLRESLRLRLVGHVGHCLSLIALGGALQLMYDVRSDTDALIEAVAMQRNALELLPLEHTNRCTALEKLATALLSGPEAPSWTEAFNLYQEALATCPEGYAERVKMLAGMSKCHIRPDSPFFDFSLGISYLSAAYADKFNHAHQRLRSAIQSLREVEDAYEATKKRAPTSLPSNREIQVLELYTQVMGLLPYVANFGLDYDTRLRSLAGTDEIVRNAASRATHLGQLSFALELLEEGRGIFWSQSLCLRGTGFDGVPNDDRCELERLLRLLEHGARARTDPEQTAVLRDRELERRRQLNSEAEALIAKIRSYPGLERFLMPAAFDSILAALPEGHIVVVNASQLGHHALLLNRACRTAMALTLRSPRAGFDSAFLRTQLPRDMTPSVSTNHFNGTRAMRLDTGHVARSLESMLALLWTSIVEPVFSKMNLQVSI